MGLTKNLGWLSKYITADSSGVGLIGIGASSGLTEKLTLDGNMQIKSGGAVKFNRTDNAISTDLYDAGTYFVLNNRNGNGFDFQATGVSKIRINPTGNLELKNSDSRLLGGAVGGRLVVSNSDTTS